MNEILADKSEFQKAALAKLEEWYGASPKEILHTWWDSGDTMYTIVRSKKKHIIVHEFIRIFSVGNSIMLSLDNKVEINRED